MSADQVRLQPTNQGIQGRIRWFVFPLDKSFKKLEELRKGIGDYLVQHSGIVTRYNVVTVLIR